MSLQLHRGTGEALVDLYSECLADPEWRALYGWSVDVSVQGLVTDDLPSVDRWVGVLGGRYVGFVHLQQEARWSRFCVMTGGVRPSHLGTALPAMLAEIAIELVWSMRDVDHIVCVVAHEHVRSQQLLEALGFVVPARPSVWHGLLVGSGLAENPPRRVVLALERHSSPTDLRIALGLRRSRGT